MLLSHREYYRDRLTEYELCQDFPGDEILIDGLHSMQTHFDHNGVNITIPVVRVMNTVHFIAAYMFSTECSGDPMEYEVMASMSCGRDKQLAIVSMIVLAALLKRTEGFRAKQCRNLILDNRTPDFEEGVTLYDRFLCSAEKRFAEEDFLIDTHAQIQQLQAENTRLISENIKLKYTITTMEKDKPQTIIYNYGTYNDIHDNPHSTIYTTAPSTPAPSINTPEPSSSVSPESHSEPSSSVSPESDSEPSSSVSPESNSGNSLFCRITKAAYDKGIAQQVEDDLRSASVSAPKLVKALNTNDALGYTDTKNLSSKELYELLNEHYGLTFKQRNFDTYRSK